MAKKYPVLESLELDIKMFKKVFVDAVQAVVNQHVSNYPIFVAHKEELVIGIPILDMEKSGSNWSYNVSSLEEFVTKGIIERSKVDSFKKVYKNPNKFLCLFVFEDEGANFVFSPLEFQ